MSQTTVSTKFQIVIPREIRKKIKIQPGQKMDVDMVGDKIMVSHSHPKAEWKWPEDYIKNLKGLWKPEEIDTYLEKERNSWD